MYYVVVCVRILLQLLSSCARSKRVSRAFVGVFPEAFHSPRNSTLVVTAAAAERTVENDTSGVGKTEYAVYVVITRLRLGRVVVVLILRAHITL